MAFAKLVGLLKTEIYVRPENMEHNTGYKVASLAFTTRRFNAIKNSIPAELALNETVTGIYYLPFKYAEHPKYKFTSANVDEINRAIQDQTHNVYVVHKGYTLGQPVIDLVYVKAGEPLPYKIYEGLDKDNKPYVKRNHKETVESEDPSEHGTSSKVLKG